MSLSEGAPFPRKSICDVLCFLSKILASHIIFRHGRWSSSRRVVGLIDSRVAYPRCSCPSGVASRTVELVVNTFAYERYCVALIWPELDVNRSKAIEIGLDLSRKLSGNGKNGTTEAGVRQSTRSQLTEERSRRVSTDKVPASLCFDRGPHNQELIGTIHMRLVDTVADHLARACCTSF